MATHLKSLGFNHDFTTMEICDYLYPLLKDEIIIPSINNFSYCFSLNENNIYVLEESTRHILFSKIRDCMNCLTKEYVAFKIYTINVKISELNKFINEHGDVNEINKNHIMFLEKDKKQICDKINKLMKIPFIDKLAKNLLLKFDNKDFLNKMNDTKHIVAFQNGIFDLKNGNFRKIEKEDCIANHLDYKYENSSDVILQDVKNEIKKICNDDDVMVEFMLSWLGYCLTGETKEDKFLIVMGDSGNGKNTIAKIFQICFPQYTELMDSKLFIKSCIRNRVPEIKHARMIYINGCQMQKLNTEVLKHFCDGSIRNNGMYETSKIIDMNAKLFITITTRNPMPTTDENIQYRRVVVQCNNKFIDGNSYDKKGYYEEVKYFSDKFKNNNILKYGFVNLIIQYAMNYYKSGLYIPKELIK